MIYDRVDKEITTMSRVNGLSEANITALALHEPSGTIIVGYANANIDLIQEDQIINVPDIVQSNLFGKKTINDVHVYDDVALISCGFGIVKLDINKQEIKETYFIADNAGQVEVNAITTTPTRIYAATVAGVYAADKTNPNLIDFNSWSQQSLNKSGNFNTITSIGENVFTNVSLEAFHSDTVYKFDGNNWDRFGDFTWTTNRLRSIGDIIYACHFAAITTYEQDGTSIRNTGVDIIPGFRPSDVVVDEFNHRWIADKNNALVHNWFGINVEYIKPNTPENGSAFAVDAHDGKILIAGGSIDGSWGNTFSSSGIHYFDGVNWQHFAGSEVNGALDFINVSIDRASDKLYASSWKDGAFELQGNQVVEHYTDSNSSLQVRTNDNLGYIRVAGSDVDSKGRRWFVNSEVAEPLSVRRPDGSWESYSLSPAATSDNLLRGLLIDENDNKWIFKRRDGLIVFNENNTIVDKTDDRVLELGTSAGNGNLPSDEVFCLAEDLDGEIWAGTGEGVAVFYNPELLFDQSGDFIDAQPILIQIDGVVNKLLAEERVTAIAVDGANRKWFGTANGGVFYFSQDGTQQIHHFTKENSPLLSNTILDISIDAITGFVYIATEVGLLAYLGEAIEPREDLTGVYAFPNPVRPEYKGPIGITGLVRDGSVKITDVNGNLVFETTSSGGRAIWDGQTLDGDEVASGVYLVFITNFDGSETLVSKIAVVR